MALPRRHPESSFVVPFSFQFVQPLLHVPSFVHDAVLSDEEYYRCASTKRPASHTTCLIRGAQCEPPENFRATPIALSLRKTPVLLPPDLVLSKRYLLQNLA